MKEIKHLKILLPVHVFFPKHFYGTETYTYELAKSLQLIGHEATILTTTPYGEEGSGRLHSVYYYDDLRVHCIDLNLKPHSCFKDTYYREDLYDMFREIIGEINPDIAHTTHLINHTAILLEVLRDLEVPTVGTLTDFFGLCFNSRLERYDGVLCLGPNKKSTNCLCCYLKVTEKVLSDNFLRLAYKSSILLRIISHLSVYLWRFPVLRRKTFSGQVFDVICRASTLSHLYGTYKYMITATDFLYEAYAANGFSQNRLKKINFGIKLDLLKDYQEGKKKTGAVVKFGYIGQIAPHKGLDLLIKAYLRLRGGNKSLVVYGPFDQDSLYMNELLRLCSGIDEIEFRNTFPREELALRLSELDILVIPSRWYENSPLVLLYALATRTPVVVTDVKGMSEFVKDGFNGYTFRKDSVDDLTKILQKIVDDPSCIERLSENATYTKDVSDHAQDVLKVYEEALKG